MKITIGPNESGQRIDRFLRKYLKDVPLSAIFKSLRKGDVKVNGKKVKEKYELLDGDEINIFLTTEVTKNKVDTIDKYDAELKVTYEDKNILMVEKRPNILVHSDEKSIKNEEPTLSDFVVSYLHKRGDYKPEQELTFKPSPCNRLDRNTSGIVIFGKNFEALQDLNEMIRDRRIKKYYCALVKGRIADGIHTAYIVKDIERNISKIVDTPRRGAKKISMEVKTMQSDGLYSFIDIELITGRSHQLRTHLAHLGNPILGDLKYGNKKINSFFLNKYGLDYQFLYAYKLVFKDCTEKLSYMENKTIAEGLPPIFKKIKRDVFKINI
jgi:23S rRNA pseudouridine955/2504/2580 synthase